jgi:hypothetical protein
MHVLMGALSLTMKLTVKGEVQQTRQQPTNALFVYLLYISILLHVSARSGHPQGVIQ